MLKRIVIHQIKQIMKKMMSSALFLFSFLLISLSVKGFVVTNVNGDSLNYLYIMTENYLLVKNGNNKLDTTLKVYCSVPFEYEKETGFLKIRVRDYIPVKIIIKNNEKADSIILSVKLSPFESLNINVCNATNDKDSILLKEFTPIYVNILIDESYKILTNYTQQIHIISYITDENRNIIPIVITKKNTYKYELLIPSDIYVLHTGNCLNLHIVPYQSDNYTEKGIRSIIHKEKSFLICFPSFELMKE